MRESRTSGSVRGAPGNRRPYRDHETRAYIATSWYDSGFHIVDISDPRDLRMVGTLDLPGHARGVDVSGTYAFVADWDVGLQVIDIADPQHPTAVGGPGILCSAARVSGGYLYLQSDTLRIMDIEDPLHPQEAATIDVSTFDIVFEDHYAYATTSDGLQIIDVEDPLDPRVLGGVDIPGVGRLSVLWPFAYIGTGHIGLQVVDISDPEFPLHVGGATDFCAWSTAVSETHVLSADRILPLQCDSTDAPDTDSSPNLIVRSYPNPGCRGAMLRLELPAPGRVRAAVHDLTGRQIRLLFDRVWPVGGHDFAWDGRDQEGNPVTSGLYLIRINTQNGDVATARALIIR